VAVAVNPEDARYKKYVGQTFEIQSFCGAKLSIKIVADDSVDKEYGTGAVGVTPAHSMIDAEIAKRHNLPTIQVINEYAKMMVDTPTLKDKKVAEAREIIVEWLRAEGLLEKEEEVVQNLSLAERTGGIIEPLPKLQWFIDVNKPIPSRENKSLKQLMHDAVERDGIKILPDRFEKVYYHWIENLRDWCISRQIWFGHRIPVWYCLHCKNVEVDAKIDRNIFLVRHGETDHNMGKKMQGSSDIPLNDEGRTQAMAAAEKLENQGIKYIICSNLSRAKETAEIIQKRIGGELIVIENLREKNYGDSEGMDTDEAKQSYPDIYTYEGKATNGESYKEVEERVFVELENIIKKYKDNVAIVSHGAVMRTMLRRIKNVDPALIMQIRTIKNCEIVPMQILHSPCSKCGKHFFEQDEDTLDTWFSSGLWTFSTLGWPENTKDMQTYHPTALLETGYDILFFWVARMILMSKYLIGDIPFKTVYLHGLVRDSKGQKISKSLGNNVEPLEMIAKYGADAVRMSLIVGTGPGNDSKMSEDKLKAYKHFANKLWNVARFVLWQKEHMQHVTLNSDKDKEYLKELMDIEIDITKDLKSYKIHLAAEKIYHYVWHKFADVIIEEYKNKLVSFDTLDTILEASLKLLHPFMPFITEEIWGSLGKKNLLLVEKWPSHISE
jgi:valyl-tRNA synthetase